VRILFATHHASRIAGAETYVDTVAVALNGRGHEVALLTEHPPVAGREPINGAQAQWRAADRGEAQAIACARDWRPDVVYVQGLASVGLERAVMGVASPVLFEHSYAGLCISGSRTWQSHGTQCPRPLGPGCLAHYFPHRCGGRSPLTMVRDYQVQRARQRLHSGYHAIIVASRHMAALLANEGCGGRVHVLPPPVPVPTTSSPRRVGTPVRVVYAGRLERLKGVHLLYDAARLAAARLGRPVELSIAGDGPMRAMLERQSRRSSAEGVRIILQGWQTASQRDTLLSSTDVIVVPSLWPEPFGLAGLEAARFGVPAVAFASGGVPDWLHHGVNGLVTAERCARALGDGIAALVADDARYERLSAGALAAARAAAPEEHVAKLERLFAESAQ